MPVSRENSGKENDISHTLLQPSGSQNVFEPDVLYDGDLENGYPHNDELYSLNQDEERKMNDLLLKILNLWPTVDSEKPTEEQ